MKLRVDHIIRFALILTGTTALAWWLTYNPYGSLTASVPGMDNRGQGVAAEALVNIGEHFELFEEHSSSLTETWPRFRGQEFDNLSKSSVNLIDRFGQEGPRILWQLDTGEGHAGAAIWKGEVYFLDYDEDLRADMLRCISLEDGKELWRRWYHVNVRRNHGMSRTVPAVTEDFILTIGPRSHVMCVERETGEFLWGIDIERDYEADIPLWYTGQCPLIYNGKAIIAPGGTSLMIAVDCVSGEVLWEVPNPHNWKMSHSSVMLYEFGGREMFVYSAYGAVFAVAADGPDEGTILWETTEWNHKVIAPSPVCMPDGKILLTAGYGSGSMMLQLHVRNGEYEVEVLEAFSPREGIASEQQTPLYYMGHLFGIEPKDAGALRNQLVCYHPDKPTEPVWSSGPAARFGLGPYIIADEKLYILSDDGTFTIVKPDLSQYIQLEQVKLFDGHDAWGPFAIADGFMVMRDSENVFCLDLRVD